MLRYLTSFLFIGLSVAVFLMFTEVLYRDTQELRAERSTYEEAFSNSKALENERDRLITDSNAISNENKERLKKMLPDNVDNIRLILEIEKIAAPYGMVLKDVEYSVVPADKENTTDSVTNTASGKGKNLKENYDSWELGFSINGTYGNFINFMRNLESNLRIVDISSIQFSSSPTGKEGSASCENYKYSFTIKTYWLKN